MTGKEFAMAALLLAVAFNNLAQAQISWVGTVTECSSREYVGKTVGFVDLDRRNPKYLWPSGHQTESFKAYDDKNLLVLFFVSETLGSTETVHLEKLNKRFTIVTVPTAAVSFSVPGTPAPQLQPTICRGTLG